MHIIECYCIYWSNMSEKILGEKLFFADNNDVMTEHDYSEALET